jgi:hypothetical protein
MHYYNDYCIYLLNATIFVIFLPDIPNKERSIMKAKFLLIAILTFLVFSLSSCFIKKWFKPKVHQIEHRGDYKQMGKHAQYYPSKEKRIRKPKHHGKHYKHKMEKRRQKAANKRKEAAAQDAGNSGNFQTDWKDSTGQHPIVPNQQSTPQQPAPADTTKVRMEPPAQATPNDQSPPVPQPEQPAEKHKKKHKGKKAKKEDPTPSEQNTSSDPKTN